jgi:hypothetical protein
MIKWHKSFSVIKQILENIILNTNGPTKPKLCPNINQQPNLTSASFFTVWSTWTMEMKHIQTLTPLLALHLLISLGLHRTATLLFPHLSEPPAHATLLSLPVPVSLACHKRDPAVLRSPLDWLGICSILVLYVASLRPIFWWQPSYDQYGCGFGHL